MGKADENSGCFRVAMTCICVFYLLVTGCRQGNPDDAMVNDPNSLIAKVSAVVEAGETQKGFALATRTSEGVTIDALAEPGRLAFTVKGTIESNSTRSIPLVPRPTDSQELTEEQEQAVLQLLSASGSFVRPLKVRVRHLGNIVTANVVFGFMGEENPARRIKLTLRLENAYGSSEMIEQECMDVRVTAKERPTAMGGRFRIYMINSEHFSFDLKLLDIIEQISVVFEEL